MEKFIEKVVEEMQKVYPDAKLEVKEVNKNNGISLTGLIIRTDDTNMSPTIYLDPYYENYSEGEMDMADVVERICKVYEDAKPSTSFDVDSFANYERAKSRICLKLINFEQNEALLGQIPHIKWLDLAICFYYLIEAEECATILVRNEHIARWGVTPEQLLDVAKENTAKLMPIQTMSLAEMLGFPPFGEEPFQIATNQKKLYGACAMYQDSLLEDIANTWDDDVTIIPSSVHEVLLMPSKSIENNTLTNLIGEVNETEVDDQEVLSSHPYVYKREEGEVVCA